MTLLIFLVDLNNVVVNVVSILSLIFDISRTFSKPLGTVQKQFNYDWHPRHFLVLKLFSAL